MPCVIVKRRGVRRRQVCGAFAIWGTTFEQLRRVGSAAMKRKEGMIDAEEG